MSHSEQLTREGDTLYLRGKVTFQTVHALYRALDRELAGSGIGTLDCSGVEQCDSSAISLLLASLRFAGQRQGRLQIRGMNSQLQSLARLYEVEPVLTS